MNFRIHPFMFELLLIHRYKYIVGPLALNVKIMNQKQHKVNASQGEELIYV